MDRQQKLPLAALLKKHVAKKTKSFHVPGHKSGLLYGRAADELLAYDLTEISGLDDLHQPNGAILEAQELLAALYGAEKSYWLVGGTTSGNLTMLSAILQPRDQVIVARDAHQSILHGIELAGAEPIFIAPRLDETAGVATGIDLEQLQRALRCYPESKACVFTYPSYYGTTFDIEAAIELVHARGMVALVDEAHGAHLIADAAFPQSALALGADIVVQSAHKTLPALTMGAFLHIHPHAASFSPAIEHYLQIFQTSSPSYLVMASLDKARHYLATYRPEDMTAFLRMKRSWLTWLEAQGLECILPADPLKVIVRKRGYSGFELQQVLEAHSYYPELADQQQVLLILPLLKAGMVFSPEGSLALADRPVASRSSEPPQLDTITTLELAYREMLGRGEELIALADSPGRIAAETIAVYPPGIPQLLRGERITEAHLEQLQAIRRLHRHGGEALNAQQLRVFRE